MPHLLLLVQALLLLPVLIGCWQLIVPRTGAS
jgi:hypothetical protein